MKLNQTLIPLLLFTLTLIFFSKIILNPDEIVYPVPDIVNMISSWRIVFAKAFHTFGEFPMWNNYETAGTPFIGNILSSMFYPFNLLFLILPVDYAFGYKFIIDVSLAGIFMYLLSRGLKLDRYSSFFSAIVYMFSGVFIGRMYIGHEQAMDIIALTPLLLFLFLKSLSEKTTKYAILTGIVLGFQILAGYLQFAIYATYLLLFYFIYDLIFSKEFNKNILSKKLILFVLTFIVGFIISAPQFLPSLEFSKYGVHAGKPISYELLTSETTSYSLTPMYTITFLMPDFFGSRTDNTFWASDEFEESTAYFGILPLLLTALPIVFRREKYVIFFAVLALIALFFSYGQYNPLFPYLHKIILFLDIVRSPGRFLFLFVLSVAVLSGFGFNLLIGMVKKKNKIMVNRLVKILLVFSLLTYIVSIGFFLNKDKIINFAESRINNIVETKLATPSTDRIGNYVLDFYSKNAYNIAERTYNYINLDIIKLLFVFLATAITLFSAIKFNIKLHYISVILILIALFDLWMFGLKYIETAPLKKVYPQDEIIEFISEDNRNDRFRVLGINRTMENRFATRNSIETLDGILPPSLRIYVEYFTSIDNKTFTGDLSDTAVKKISHPKMLDLLNVKYVLSTEKLNDDYNEHYTLLFHTNITKLDIRKKLEFNQTVYVYKNNNYLPRVFVVDNFKVISDVNKILAELKRDGFDPRSYIILEKSPQTIFKETDINEKSQAKIDYYSPNRITIFANMTKPGFIVLSEVWYPDWKAYVYDCLNNRCSSDKKETEIFKTDYLFRSIYLEEGQYKVEFVYSTLNSFIERLK